MRCFAQPRLIAVSKTPTELLQKQPSCCRSSKHATPGQRKPLLLVDPSPHLVRESSGDSGSSLGACQNIWFCHDLGLTAKLPALPLLGTHFAVHFLPVARRNIWHSNWSNGALRGVRVLPVPAGANLKCTVQVHLAVRSPCATRGHKPERAHLPQPRR